MTRLYKYSIIYSIKYHQTFGLNYYITTAVTPTRQAGIYSTSFTQLTEQKWSFFFLYMPLVRPFSIAFHIRVLDEYLFIYGLLTSFQLK